jgi:Protein of unknown function (DUF3551)
VNLTGLISDVVCEIMHTRRSRSGHVQQFRETRMRKILATLALAAAAAGTADTGFAQSAYDYPWCALRGSRSGGQSCYFTSYRQCMDSLSGIGGSCIRSPYYRGPEPRRGQSYVRY